jgi:2Fe-2S ferredoxin
MPQLTVLPHQELCPGGISFEVKSGRSLCEALLAHGVAIEHACDMVSACATCHVLIREGASTLPPADDEEEDQLDKAWGVEPCSRLACAARVGHGDITIELPRHSRNHARERLA